MEMEDDARRVADEIYRALQQKDVAALQRLAHPECECEVTEGLPQGIGGSHRGGDAVLAMWGRVARLFEIHPEPREFLDAGPGRLVVLGRYRGRARSTGREVDAAFAHVIAVQDGRLRRLVQVTDSQRWREALTAPADPGAV
jgi:ketosteroid isomerase-like protein